jgi:GNAT superfamily N-acetyltransferase
MEFPEGYSQRGARPDDAQRIADLVEAADLVDIGEKMFDVSDIETDWASPDLSLDEDVILVERGDDLAAWGQVSGERADADVHPDHRGRGIGRALVEWTEDRARRSAARPSDARIGQTLIEGLAGTEELFVARGYEKGWDSWVLRLPPDAEMSAPAPPAGITIRVARPDEDHAVYTVVENAFNEWDDRTPRTFEQWRAGSIERPDFDRSLLLVAAGADGPVGVCFGLHYPGEGWADQIAVVPEYRGRGLARAMLAQLFEEFRSRGETRLGLNTDSRTGALGLYLELGMVVARTFTRWSRPL